MKTFIGMILLIPVLLWGGLRIYKGITYKIDCGGHLKRAADANTVELAAKELGVALQYLEQRGMTEGYTSVLWNTPDEDVGFWYNNLSSAQSELAKVGDETTQLERTNLLMKLRETLLDQGERGSLITEPTAISLFPNNGTWAIFGTFAWLLALIGIVLIVVWFMKRRAAKL